MSVLRPGRKSNYLPDLSKFARPGCGRLHMSRQWFYKVIVRAPVVSSHWRVVVGLLRVWHWSPVLASSFGQALIMIDDSE